MKRIHLTRDGFAVLFAAVAGLLLCLSAPVNAQVLITEVVSIGNTMASDADTMIKEAQVNNMNWKMLAKYQDKMLAHIRNMTQMKNGITNEKGRAQTEMDSIRRSQTVPQAQWSAEVKQRYQKCEDVIHNCDQAMQQLTTAADISRKVQLSLQNKNGQDFRAFAPQYRQRMQQITGLVQQIAANAASMTVFDSSKAAPIRFINGGKEVAFQVGGVEIKPGETRDLPYRKTLTIRAVALTPRRVLIRQRTAAPTRNATVEPGSDDYTFTYTVNTGGGVINRVIWNSEKEEYNWTGPTMMLSTSRPFDLGKPAITMGKRTGDTFTWTLPDISKSRFGSGSAGVQSFLLLVRGEVNWKTTRSGASANATQTEREAFSGELKISVTPQ